VAVVYLCRGRSRACCGKHSIVLFSISFEFNSPPYFLKIVIKSRKDSGSPNGCLIVSVDGTDVRILQPSQETLFVVVVQDGREMWMAVRDWGGYSGRKYCVCYWNARTLLVSIQISKFLAVAWRIGWASLEGWRQMMVIHRGGAPRKVLKVFRVHVETRPRIKRYRIGCGVDKS
jgi:hypothetical protein